MTMKDGSRVRIIHEPAPATRPGIGCAWTTASPREVPLEETVWEGPENDGDELGACERALLDRAECSAQNRRTLRSSPRRYRKAIHRSGRKHQNADALSRRGCKQGRLKCSPAEVPVGAVKLDAANPINQWQESDKELQQIREWSTQRTCPQAAPEGSRLLRSLWSQRDRIVVHEGSICWKLETPDTGETRLLQVIPRQRIPKILAAIHNQQSGAHLGVAKTLAMVRQRYYWPQQREDVEDWCRACQTWAARAVPTKKPQAPMQLYEAVRERAGREQRHQKFWKDSKAHRPLYYTGDQDKTNLGTYWNGPYEVQKKLDWNMYRVKEMKGRRQSLVVHFDRLKPYHGSQLLGEGRQKPREKRKTRRSPWLRDSIHDLRVEQGTCS
ncbi:Gypsy retrotransposon integrase-like protein 1 [Trichinella nativa]|uniref:RNA-directed DNA polymerase n=1 Tax=Trichinella nativa TaxID=6335 RepID=A0A0V1KNN3_9BILA|nr:Gypsy retrotransposon integrase-like protein 1 [Trichinella nativa]